MRFFLRVRVLCSLVDRAEAEAAFPVALAAEWIKAANARGFDCRDRWQRDGYGHYGLAANPGREGEGHSGRKKNDGKKQKDSQDDDLDDDCLGPSRTRCQASLES